MTEIKGELITGDCLVGLKTMQENTVDMLCTDEPYGIKFMGKPWDASVPSVEIWKECLRVLKPGAFAFVMSSPRQDVLAQTIVRLAEAGFETSFTSLYWTYASGFPKAADVSLLVDKKFGLERGRVKQPHDQRAWREKEGRTDFQETMADDNPILPQAKALQGAYAGFQPKPAVEVVVVAMKPLSEKSFTDQALANGKGITWLDDCRIPYQNEDDLTTTQNKANKDLCKYANRDKLNGVWGEKTTGYSATEIQEFGNPQGRFPANLIVSDDVLNDGRNYKTGDCDYKMNNENRNIYGKYSGNVHVKHKGDSGSYSRYFDLDKWAEKTLPFLIVEKPSKAEREAGLLAFCEQQVTDGRQKDADNAFQRGKTQRKNTHPTVKPIQLMSYLISMGSRHGDLVLDPFAGSGSTLIAAQLLRRRFIGYEINAEYADIARARLASFLPTASLEEFVQ